MYVGGMKRIVKHDTVWEKLKAHVDNCTNKGNSKQNKDWSC